MICLFETKEIWTGLMILRRTIFNLEQSIFEIILYITLQQVMGLNSVKLSG